MLSFTKLKVLIVAKTYPTPARKGVEVSCTQGITEQGRWIRLFPVPFRLLGQEQRFHKYQWVQVDAGKARDPRPESYQINPDTITVLTEPLSTDAKWKLRKDVVYPLRARSIEVLDEARTRSGASLGFIRPRTISRFIIKPASPDWTPEQQAKLSQLTYFDRVPSRTLEKIPFDFQYSFTCDDPRCKGHTLKILDWELAESYRSWSRKYGFNWESKIRDKYETCMIGKKDTHFFVGTHSRWPHIWMITGLFYPPV
jgi:hypothetical protein